LAILDKSASGPDIRNTLPLDQITDVDPLTKDWPLLFSSLKEAMNFIKQVASSNLEYQYFMNSLVETVEEYKMMFSYQAMAAYSTYYKSWFEILPSIKCLVLLIRAKGNDAVSDEDFIKMQSLVSNCIAREISHPDHNLHLANKKEFYKYFDEFLERL
jgi:hypothetical protein